MVIPVRDRQAQLARCLAGLGEAPGPAPRSGLAGTLRVIVVDDASCDPAAIAQLAKDADAHVLRRPVNGGPGAARNTGLAAADTPLVAFLDSDCVPSPGWLDVLLPYFADPAVGAAAPRIVPHERGRTWLARYEGASSTLDMGARASIVRPGSRVPYVPGAAMVVRKAAAGAGFAEDTRVGEPPDEVDVLAAAGWPAAGAALTGTGIALLARRLARLTGEDWPRPAARTAWQLATRLAGGGTLAAGRPLGSAISRTWWPLALPAAVAVRRLRLPLAALVLAPPLLDWLDRRPPLDPARYVAARLLDDVGYSLGVWQGCAGRRTIRPLLPRLGSPYADSPRAKSAGTMMSSADRS